MNSTEVRQSVIAYHANVTQPDVANFLAGRMEYVKPEKRERIAQALKLTKAELVRRHLLSGRTITPLESLKLYGLHALSQTITRLRRQGYDIRNSIPECRKNQTYAIYRLYQEGM